MFNSPFLRLVVALVIAVPIVYSLFILMSSLINVTEIRVDKGEQRVLASITPQQQDTEVRTRQRSKPKRLDSAAKPPPPPKVSATKSQINLPTPRIAGAAPTELNLGRSHWQSIRWQFQTGTPSRSGRPRRRSPSELQSVASREPAMFALTWTHVGGPTTSRQPARMICSHGKQSAPFHAWNLLRRSFAARRQSVRTWSTRLNSSFSSSGLVTFVQIHGAPQ